MILARAAIACFLMPAAALAQQSPSSLERRWPDGQPQQQQSRQPARQNAAPAREAEEAASKRRAQPQPARVIACSGLFAKDSSHIKLATFVGADNIAWTQVAGPEGSRLNATVLYPRDPRRRLEVLWNLESARSDTQLIVITGESTWAGPKGVKLGTPLATVEKINGRPFTIKSFGGETGGMVTTWEGGHLATLPGGCKMGVRFAPDPKLPPPTEELAGGKDFASNVPAVKAMAPKVAEIIIGY
jgi:hypothetical protein